MFVHCVLRARCCDQSRRIAMNSSAPSDAPPGGVVAILAITAFVIAGGIHYQSPMLVAIAAEFQADMATAGWIPTLSFAGMLAGVILLVPLGDRLDKRTLILGQFAVLCAAQAVMACAPSIEVLVAASFITGVCSSLAQVMIAIVADIAHPNARGRAVGTQLSALFVGILFARIAGGLIAEHYGWRFSYVPRPACISRSRRCSRPDCPARVRRPASPIAHRSGR
jgi:predicted MFS family arabinose efflux permease